MAYTMLTSWPMPWMVVAWMVMVALLLAVSMTMLSSCRRSSGWVSAVMCGTQVRRTMRKEAQRSAANMAGVNNRDTVAQEMKRRKEVTELC